MYDNGANPSVTKDHIILHHVTYVQSYSIGGIGDESMYTKKGIYYLQCSTNQGIPVHMFFSE